MKTLELQINKYLRSLKNAEYLWRKEFQYLYNKKPKTFTKTINVISRCSNYPNPELQYPKVKPQFINDKFLIRVKNLNKEFVNIILNVPDECFKHEITESLFQETKEELEEEFQKTKKYYNNYINTYQLEIN